jgi:micrococcal nuclease
VQSWILPTAVVAAALVLAGCGGQAATSAPSGPAPGSFAAGPAAPGAANGGLRPKGEAVSGNQVIRVVDGDTLHVRLGGRDTTVRMIGMNTPETVKENTPVECYGPEASDYAKHTLANQSVTLEFDESQGRTDQYGRTLAYVWLENADGTLTLVNLDEIERGLARERQYGPTPYAWKKDFRAAQSRARSAGAGLWGACPT